jgi:hypothetical protein
LFHADQEKALTYLTNFLNTDDPLSEMGDIFQLTVLELVRKCCIAEPAKKLKLINIIFTLSESKSSSGTM